MTGTAGRDGARAIARAAAHPMNVQPSRTLTTTTAPRSGTRRARPMKTGRRYNAADAAGQAGEHDDSQDGGDHRRSLPGLTSRRQMRRASCAGGLWDSALPALAQALHGVASRPCPGREGEVRGRWRGSWRTAAPGPGRSGRSAGPPRAPARQAAPGAVFPALRPGPAGNPVPAGRRFPLVGMCFSTRTPPRGGPAARAP